MNRKHIIITIRYSLLVDSFRTAWKIGDNSFEDYKKILFNKDRLNIKQEIFKSVTLKSLKKIDFITPEDTQLKVHILTSDELPLDNINFLEKITHEYDFIEIKKSSVKDASLHRDFNEYLSENILFGESYASVRLDDDDGLSTEWLKELLHYLNNETYSNHVISLCGGYALALDNEATFQKMVEWKWRFASAGMAYIGKKTQGKNLNIYSCGNHSIPDNRYITILDARNRYFVRTYNDFNDSGVDFPRGSLVNTNLAEELLLSNFGIMLPNHSSNEVIYDFHGFTLLYDPLRAVMGKYAERDNALLDIIIKKCSDKFYFYIDDLGYLGIDSNCQFSYQEQPDNLEYEIIFETPVKFYIKSSNGMFLSSLSTTGKGFQWKSHLRAWEYFLKVDKN